MIGFSNLSNISLGQTCIKLINFVQVCPKEMLDKLDEPITLKGVKKVS